MFYVNLLIRHRLVQLAMTESGKFSELSVDDLSTFGRVRLFGSHHFAEKMIAASELEERSGEQEDSIPADWPYARCHYTGTISSHDKKSITLYTDCGELRFVTDASTVIEDRVFAPGETVHIYARIHEGAEPAVALVTVGDELNNLAAAYRSVSVRTDAVREILGLDSQERRVLTRFLADDVYGNELFETISMLAADVMDGNPYRNDRKISADVHTLLNIQQVSEILRWVDSMPVADALKINPMLGFVALYRDLKNNSINTVIQKWSQYLFFALSDTMGKVCTDAELAAMVEEILASDSRFEEELLFELLFAKVPIEERVLHRILSFLFRDSIRSDQMLLVPALIKSRNADSICRIAEEAFLAGVDSSDPPLIYLAAAIFVYKSRDRGDDPQQLAEEKLRSEETADQLLGMAALSIMAWMDRVIGPSLQSFHLRKMEEVPPSLDRYLWYPHGRHYEFAVAFCEDMILSDVMDQQHITDDAFVSAVLDALIAESDAGETMLSLMPAGMVYCDDNRYLDKLEAAYQRNDPNEIMACFRLCQCLGCWTGKEEAFGAFRRMISVLHKFELSHSKERLHPDIYAYLRLVCQDLCHQCRDFFTQTSETALLPLEIGVEETYFDRYAELQANEGAEFILDEEEKITHYLASLRVVDQLETEYYPERTAILRNLAERSRITAPTMSSFVAINWFKYVLCRFNLSEAAIEFYRQYKDLLNRPAFLYNTEMYHGVRGYLLTDVYHFLNADSRVADALRFAADIGSLEVLEAFRPRLPDLISSLVADASSTADPCHVRQHIVDELADDFPRADYMAWGRYYDDLGIVFEVRRFTPEKKFFTELGYGAVLPELL